MQETSAVLPDSLVTSEWLAERLDDPRIRIVDIRGAVTTQDLGGGRQAATYSGSKQDYEAGHIPGAVFVDWTSDITDPDAEVKAQIAPPARFKAAMERIGIGDETAVVVADNTGGHLATRLWWALNYYGHEAVAVLDGGYARWQELGLPMTRDAPAARDVAFTPRVCPWLVASANEVHDTIGSRDRQIVDARDAGTFSGATQRGRRGGHIPSSINLPSQSLVRRDGRWMTREEIRAEAERAGVSLDKPVTAYCNGGVTATAVLFGLHRAGMPLERITNYDGSWNEWGERSDLPAEGNRDLFGAGGQE